SVLPLDPSLSESTRNEVLEVARTRWSRSHLVCAPLPTDAAPHAHRPHETHPISEPGFAMLSGGSTGRPKIIVNDGAHGGVPTDGAIEGLPGLIGLRANQVQLVCGPLFHGAPASWSSLGLFYGHS